MTVLLNSVKAEAQRRGAFMLKIEPSVLDGDPHWLVALRRRGFRPNPYATTFVMSGCWTFGPMKRIYSQI